MVIRMSVTAGSSMAGGADGVAGDAGVTGAVPAEGARSVLAHAAPSKTTSVGAATRVRRLRREPRWPNMTTTVGTDCLIEEHPMRGCTASTPLVHQRSRRGSAERVAVGRL